MTNEKQIQMRNIDTEDQVSFLDLETDVLFGWEGRKSDLVVDAIIRGIEQGDQFPPVYVNHLGGNRFSLDSCHEFEDTGICDGGHNRAVGHYIAGVPLRVKIVKGDDYWKGKATIPISEIVIVEDNGRYQKLKENSHLAYR